MNLPLDGSGAAFAEDVPFSMFSLNHFPAVDCSVLFSKNRQQH